MPAEIEVPTEHLHETIHEAHHHAHAHHEAPHGSDETQREHARFVQGVAISSAILAVLAALAALFAGHFANDAMIERIEAGDQWAFFQAKGIKRNLLASKIATLAALQKAAAPDDQRKLAQYGREKDAIQRQARAYTEKSEGHLTQHTRLAGSVTFFQVAIALGAIAVLTRKKRLWWASLVVGLCGAVTLLYGFLPPPHPRAEVSIQHQTGAEPHD